MASQVIYLLFAFPNKVESFDEQDEYMNTSNETYLETQILSDRINY